MRFIINFIFYFVFFGLVFYGISEYFPEAFDTLVSIGAKTFSVLRDIFQSIYDKINQAVNS